MFRPAAGFLQKELWQVLALCHAAVWLQAAANQAMVVVTISADTSSIRGASTITGAYIAFEVDGTWEQEQLFAAQIAASSTSTIEVLLPGRPTSMALRAPTESPPFIDAWGLRKLTLAFVDTGEQYELLPDCLASQPDTCSYYPDSPYWVYRDDEYNIFPIPTTTSSTTSTSTTTCSTTTVTSTSTWTASSTTTTTTTGTTTTTVTTTSTTTISSTSTLTSSTSTTTVASANANFFVTSFTTTQTLTPTKTTTLSSTHTTATSLVPSSVPLELEVDRVEAISTTATSTAAPAAAAKGGGSSKKSLESAPSTSRPKPMLDIPTTTTDESRTLTIHGGILRGASTTTSAETVDLDDEAVEWNETDLELARPEDDDGATTKEEEEPQPRVSVLASIVLVVGFVGLLLLVAMTSASAWRARRNSKKVRIHIIADARSGSNLGDPDPHCLTSSSNYNFSPSSSQLRTTCSSALWNNKKVTALVSICAMATSFASLAVLAHPGCSAVQQVFLALLSLTSVSVTLISTFVVVGRERRERATEASSGGAGFHPVILT